MNAVVSEKQALTGIEGRREWARQLVRLSPLKQRKFSILRERLGNVIGKRCLDVGSDNGVISLLLRELGGEWSSIDLIPQTVEAIRDLVGERVWQTDGVSTPFTDADFDCVVIVDLLEHLETDRQFVREMARILKPGGGFVVNVPNPHNGFMRWLRYRLGQTDAAHGHVRSGYTLAELQVLLGDDFVVEQYHGYGRFWSELVDAAITFALHLLKRGAGSKKGSVVTHTDASEMRRSFGVLKLIAPILHMMVALDRWTWWAPTNMLVVVARRVAPHGV